MEFGIYNIGIMGVVFGVILLVLSILSCIALCAGKTKYKSLKIILGIFYFCIGLACMIGGS